METTSENIRQLLEMLDNPDAYTEQEIQDIINRDEDTRETYRLMVEAKRSSRHRQANKPVDVDTAWQRFISSEELKVKSEELATARPTVQPHSQFSFFSSQFRKIAASFIGILLVSGIAFAAIHFVRQSQKAEATEQEDITAVANSSLITHHSSLQGDTIAAPKPVIYDNIPLEKMLPEIAAHYDVKVTFVNDEARQLRFYFVWKQDETLDAVLHRLNLFESVTVQLKSDKIVVE